MGDWADEVANKVGVEHGLTDGPRRRIASELRRAERRGIERAAEVCDIEAKAYDPEGDCWLTARDCARIIRELLVKAADRIDELEARNRKLELEARSFLECQLHGCLCCDPNVCGDCPPCPRCRMAATLSETREPSRG